MWGGVSLLLALLVLLGPSHALLHFREERVHGSLKHSDFTLVHILERGVMEHHRHFRVADVEGDHIRRRLAHFHRFRERHPRDPSSSSSSSFSSPVPDPTDKGTVINLADMSFNAYENRNITTKWRPVPGYEVKEEFGWEENGLRGYVFANEDRSLLIMSVKGTTFKFFGEGGTSEKDRLMDNLMFSCCCAQVDPSWTPVCGCATGASTCNSSCLTDRLTQKDNYFFIAQEVYLYLQSKYPSSSVWFTGHSLGGALASLLAVANGLPAFAYEAPGDLLYAQRIGLKVDPSNMEKYHIFHYGNDADPIFLGTCQGRFSTCYQFSYAMESLCHIGNTCIYDGGPITNINNHRLEACIERFYTPQPVPPCVPQNNCQECGAWRFE